MLAFGAGGLDVAVAMGGGTYYLSLIHIFIIFFNIFLEIFIFVIRKAPAKKFVQKRLMEMSKKELLW